MHDANRRKLSPSFGCGSLRGESKMLFELLARFNVANFSNLLALLIEFVSSD